MRYFNGGDKYNSNQGVTKLSMNSENIIQQMVLINMVRYVNTIIDADADFGDTFKKLAPEDCSVVITDDGMTFSMMLQTKDGEEHKSEREDLFNVLNTEF